MNYTELRKEPRINVSLLPEKYKEFEVLLAHGVTSIVKTADVSSSGFGFYSDLPTNEFIPGQKIVLYPVGETHPVYGTIMHTEIVANQTRVGVLLGKFGGYEKYKEVIDELLELNQLGK
jgi:hypothetical protein